MFTARYELSPYKKQTRFIFIEAVVFIMETKFVLCEVGTEFFI